MLLIKIQTVVLISQLLLKYYELYLNRIISGKNTSLRFMISTLQRGETSVLVLLFKLFTFVTTNMRKQKCKYNWTQSLFC